VADWESLGPEVLAVPWWGEEVGDRLRGLIDAAPQVARVVLYDPAGDEEVQRAEVAAMLGRLGSDDADGLVLGARPTDALKEAKDGLFVRSLDRSGVVTLLPPAVLTADVVRAALAEPGGDGTCLDLLITSGARLRWRPSFRSSAGSS
jgi:hypothetical protein